jgi:hypothetical protein
MPTSHPTIYLIAGCNGAGKTTFAKEFLPSIGVLRFRQQSYWRNPPLTVSFSCERFFPSMKKSLHNGLQPIPESKMSTEARVASQAHRRATRKKRAELRRRGLPMIIWKDGKVREVPA